MNQDWVVRSEGCRATVSCVRSDSGTTGLMIPVEKRIASRNKNDYSPGRLLCQTLDQNEDSLRHPQLGSPGFWVFASARGSKAGHSQTGSTTFRRAAVAKTSAMIAQPFPSS